MVKRQHIITSSYLSETATDENVRKMRLDAYKLYRQRVAIAFEDAADVEDILEIAGRFVKAVDELATNPMKTIPEEDESGATHSQRRATENEVRQIRQAVRNTKNYRLLLDSTNKIKESFRTRLMDIHSAYYTFICTHVGEYPRPRWAQICRMDNEVTAHVARVAHAEQQLTSDVALLRKFLREQLFDEYCLMRGTPVEMKNEIWLRYGKCLSLGQEIGKCERSLTMKTAENLDLGDREIGERLDRMIDASGLDPSWVMDHIEDYYAGNDHIGTWQRYVQGCRWNDLAAKFIDDIQQLAKINRSINSSNSGRCKIMFNIQNTKRQFFTRLDGAQDFELSEKALRMNDESYESTSPLSSATSL